MNHIMLTHDDCKDLIDRLSERLTYPALDDLHAVYDYICDLEQALEKRD